MHAQCRSTRRTRSTRPRSLAWPLRIGALGTLRLLALFGEVVKCESAKMRKWHSIEYERLMQKITHFTHSHSEHFHIIRNLGASALIVNDAKLLLPDWRSGTLYRWKLLAPDRRSVPKYDTITIARSAKIAKHHEITRFHQRRPVQQTM